MSEVAATGDSLHSDKRAINQQRREHRAAELKWSADKQLRSFGRSHRSNQACHAGLSFDCRTRRNAFDFGARGLPTPAHSTKNDRRANQIGGWVVQLKSKRVVLLSAKSSMAAFWQIPYTNGKIRSSRSQI